MSWREQVRQQASFRGVPFWVTSSELSAGRRGVTHEYPGQDVPFREDLGRKARAFRVEGFVLGEDYLAARDALLTALEMAGPGELVHPYHGTRRVAVESVSIQERGDDGGLAVFSLGFVETPAAPAAPVAVPDTAAVLQARIATARTAAESQFADSYAPGVLMAGPVATLEATAAAADVAVSEAPGLGIQERAALRRQIGELRDGASLLVETVDGVSQALGKLLASLPSGVAALYAVTAPAGAPVTTDNAALEQRNAEALARHVRALAAIRGVELAVSRTYESYDEAQAVRGAVAEQLDELQTASGDEVYVALADLREALFRAVPGDGSDLPHILTTEIDVGLPSLVLAHQLYGAVAMELDVVARNNLARPGFIPAGSMLEVLSDG